MLDVAIAVGLVAVFALAACRFLNDLERELEARWPLSKARAWEDISRRDR